MAAVRGAIAHLLALAGLGAIVSEALVPGVSVDGHLHTLEAIRNGSAHLPTGGYVVGVRPGAKRELLEEMQTELAFTPSLPMSEQLPMFAGVMQQAQLVWLLQKNSIRFIESDGKVAANSASAFRSHGVSVDGTWYTAAQIADGHVKLPTCSYVVEVMQLAKKALLSQMWNEWMWSPTEAYGEQRPVFAGVLNQSHICWLLRFDEVRFIKDECAVGTKGGRTLSERAAGVLIAGELYTLAAIQSGSVQVPTGSYIVGVRPETKQALLEEMQTEFAWTPTFAMSEIMPMFVGVLGQAQVLWLLQKDVVRFIESDATVSASETQQQTSPPPPQQAFLAGRP